MATLKSGKGWLLALLLALVFIGATQQLKSAPRPSVSSEIRVALPLFTQVFMAMGDRYLAANIAAIRALVVETAKMPPDEYRILGKVQEDVSWLNPAHEDNYYIAFAILADYGEIAAAQTILARASRARFYDYQPSFFYAFNRWQYQQDPAGAASWLIAAADKLPDPDLRLTMQDIAARWMNQAEDVDLAIRVIEAMAKNAKRKDFRVYLEQRATRLKSLRSLRAAVVVFRERHGRAPTELDELVSSGILAALPPDPFNLGFLLTPQGQIVLRTSSPQS